MLDKALLKSLVRRSVISVLTVRHDAKTLIDIAETWWLLSRACCCVCYQRLSVLYLKGVEERCRHHFHAVQLPNRPEGYWQPFFWLYLFVFFGKCCFFIVSGNGQSRLMVLYINYKGRHEWVNVFWYRLSRTWGCCCDVGVLSVLPFALCAGEEQISKNHSVCVASYWEECIFVFFIGVHEGTEIVSITLLRRTPASSP